jgi:hypothetical protein
MNLYVMIFLCGFAGSAAVEIVSMYQFYQGASSSNPRARVLPARYKTVGFWVVRFLLAVIAGGLALAYEINNLY